MAKHTQGPLKANGTRVYFSNSAGGFDIRNCPDAEANAERVAACWNACEGVETEHLALVSMDRLRTETTQRLAAAGEKLLQLEAERLDLVEAVRVMARYMQPGFMDDVRSDATVSDDSAVAAVRRVFKRYDMTR